MKTQRAGRVPALFTGAATAALAVLLPIGVASQGASEEAPTGFDNLTNGYLTQGAYNQGRAAFERRMQPDMGLGPVYNAQACSECHASPAVGGVGQITTVVAGGEDALGNFIPHPGGNLIQDRATDASLVESVLPGYSIRVIRTTLNTLGSGFVECIDDSTLQAISDEQAAQSGGVIRGQVVMAPLLEKPDARRAARFGWKDQHASLPSFTAFAASGEMGLTSPLAPNEVTSNGRSTADFDLVPEPELDGDGLMKLANFMRATKAPPRDASLAATAEALWGERLFTQIGCASCHRPSITTAPAGTVINGGTFTVPAALGNKVIHPYGDFLMHDVGSGDGIRALGPPSGRYKMRTAPLWGVRTRQRLMHDGQSLSFPEAILRHRGEAAGSSDQFQALPPADQQSLVAFLKSL